MGTEIHNNSLKDLKEYLGDNFHPPEDMANAFSTEWINKKPKTEKEIEDMYIYTETYIYGLALYNTWPHRKAFYTLTKRLLKLGKITENIHIFGDGICSDSISLFLDGYKAVSVSDLQTEYYRFGRWRMKKYSTAIPAYFSDNPNIWNQRFNAMIFITVLEHIPHLLEFMKKVISHTNVVIEKSAFTAQMQQGLVVPGKTSTTRYEFYEFMENNGFKREFQLNAYSPNFWRKK